MSSWSRAMTPDDGLRQAIVDASRRRALHDCERLSQAPSIGLPIVLAAAGLALGSLLALRRRRRFAAAALVLGGCTWLALRNKGGTVSPVDEQAPDFDEKAPLIDQASSQSFPASDPPAYSRSQTAE